tara:strand:- start:424 stop:672 length:249 start_codon:yes stop_codon:yes gene_type:complete
MPWEQNGPDCQGYISYELSNTMLYISVLGEEYLLVDGSNPVGSFTKLEEAKEVAEAIETEWCKKNFNTVWVNPNTGRKNYGR